MQKNWDETLTETEYNNCIKIKWMYADFLNPLEYFNPMRWSSFMSEKEFKKKSSTNRPIYLKLQYKDTIFENTQGLNVDIKLKKLSIYKSFKFYKNYSCFESEEPIGPFKDYNAAIKVLEKIRKSTLEGLSFEFIVDYDINTNTNLIHCMSGFIYDGKCYEKPHPLPEPSFSDVMEEHWAYDCKYGCGFRGKFKDVFEHEKTCVKVTEYLNQRLKSKEWKQYIGNNSQIYIDGILQVENPTIEDEIELTEIEVPSPSAPPIDWDEEMKVLITNGLYSNKYGYAIYSHLDETLIVKIIDEDIIINILSTDILPMFPPPDYIK